MLHGPHPHCLLNYPLIVWFQSFLLLLCEAKQKEVSKKFEGAFKPIDGFLADNITTDMTALTDSKDSSKIIRNNEWLKDVKKDVHLYETLMVMKDMIQNATFKTASAEVKKN